MRFIFDNTTSPRIAQAIKVLAGGDPRRYQVWHLAEKFEERDVLDTVWIPQLAREGDWVVVSADPRITSGRAERQAWKEAGLTGFFLAKGWAGLPLWDQAWKLIQWWPRIVDQTGKVRAGATFLVPVKGTQFEQLDVTR